MTRTPKPMTTERYDDDRELLPLPRGEGWGEGQTGTSSRAFGNLARSPLLQYCIERVSNDLCLAAKPSIRIPQHLNAESSEELFPLFIMGAFVGQRMPKAIKLDCETSIFAEKIDVIRTDRMLPPEFPAVETAVAQPTPHQLFGPGPFTSKDSRPCDACHDRTLLRPASRGNTPVNLVVDYQSVPHPFPLPKGEGDSLRPVAATSRASVSESSSAHASGEPFNPMIVESAPNRRTPSLLPRGKVRMRGKPVLPQPQPTGHRIP